MKELEEEIDFSSDVAVALYEGDYKGNYVAIVKHIDNLCLYNNPNCSITMILKDKVSNRYIQSNFEIEFLNDHAEVAFQTHFEVKKINRKTRHLTLKDFKIKL